MRYETTLEFKRDQVQELLRRVGGLSIAVPQVIGMDEPYAYRNKGAYPVAAVNGPPAASLPRAATTLSPCRNPAAASSGRTRTTRPSPCCGG